MNQQQELQADKLIHFLKKLESPFPLNRKRITEILHLPSDNITDLFIKKLQNELIDEDYIQKVGNDEYYRLSQKCAGFKSFKKEHQKIQRKLYMDANAYWRAKYWWLIAIVSAALGWVLKIIEMRL
jgi:hypothetical protein